MICAKCGEEIPDNSKFCLNCGAKVMKAPKYCPNCGTELPGKSKFCLNCGIRVAGLAENINNSFDNSFENRQESTAFSQAEYSKEEPVFENDEIVSDQPEDTDALCAARIKILEQYLPYLFPDESKGRYDIIYTPKQKSKVYAQVRQKVPMGQVKQWIEITRKERIIGLFASNGVVGGQTIGIFTDKRFYSLYRHNVAVQTWVSQFKTKNYVNCNYEDITDIKPAGSEELHIFSKDKNCYVLKFSEKQLNGNVIYDLLNALVQVN
ncbi:MAG: zinc ribbon domain-containing protein [Lachnospiraceae bacterium]|nr:zinc ribbon domain-containing protein [Lachnospiraceae bacterium]